MINDHDSKSLSFRENGLLVAVVNRHRPTDEHFHRINYLRNSSAVHGESASRLLKIADHFVTLDYR